MSQKDDSGDIEALQKVFDAVLDIISDGVWDWDASSGQVKRSASWYRMLGYDVNSLPETVFTWEDIIHPDDYSRVMEHFEDYITKKSEAYCIEYRCQTKDHDYVWIEDHGRVIDWNDDGTVARMIGAHRNINEVMLVRNQFTLEKEGLLLEKNSLEHIVKERTEELLEVNKKLIEKLEEINVLAQTDQLTAIYNRYKLNEELHKEMNRSMRYHSALSLIMFDIDDFKKINDTFGHLVGDEVIQKIASQVSKIVRSSDVLARWGGDEFIIVLPETTDDEALEIALHIRDMISKITFSVDIAVSCSFGVTQFQDEEDILTLLERLDTALYDEKVCNKDGK